MKGCTALEKIEVQGNQIKDTRTLESIAPALLNLRILYLQEFNGSGGNPLCGMKNYRKKVQEIFPRLKALDGYREGTSVLEPGDIDVGGGDKVEYQCDEEWFNTDIYLANPGKTLF